MVEEAGEHAGRLEEVERVAARRRVDDHEVEAFVAVQFVERLGRHVLLRAAQRPGDVAVERVGQDSFDLLVGVGVTPHQPIEGGSGVEHHRPQLAAGLPRLVGVQLDPLGFGRQAIGEPERVGQTARRVDRDHDRASTTAGRLEPEHRRCGRLADAARATADDHRRRVDHVAVGAAAYVARPRGHVVAPIPPRSAPASSTMSAAVSPATSRAGRVTFGIGSSRGEAGDLAGLHLAP